MKVYDKLWAPNGIDIVDQKLIRLLQSSPVKRLQNIGQNGAANFFEDPLGKKLETTRYEHSCGAMILTLRIGGTNDEAIVALLHDIMHTAFSHTVDHLFEDASISFHETNKDRLLEKYEDELVDILGINWKSYFNELNYPLIKKNNPFAIDVADYTARDAYKYNICTSEEAQNQLQYLKIDENTRQLCCINEDAKKWWIKISKIVNDNIYNSPWNMAINYIFAQQIKKLIGEEKITFEMLLESDHKTENNIYILVEKFMIEYMRNKKFLLLKPESYDKNVYHHIITTKMRERYVNPPIISVDNPEIISSASRKYDMDLIYYFN
jgi:HD superfamily phosphohydrolase